MATDEHSMPTTLAPSRTVRSSGLSRSICFSISCLTLSGTPDSIAATAPSQPPLSVGLHDDALVDQIVDEVDHEQRVAFAPLVNQPRQALFAAACPPSFAARYWTTASSVRYSSGSS